MVSRTTIVLSITTGAVILVAVFWFFGGRTSVSSRLAVVRVAGGNFFAEVASDSESRARGLSGHAGLSENGGMLLLFPKPGIYSFWMKDMRFPIDILWFANGKVVFMKEEFQPPADSEKAPVIVTPNKAADVVLEVSAGSVRRFGISLGVPAVFRLPKNIPTRIR